MRFIVTAVLLLMTALGVAAQDGIYCSFSGGQINLDVKGINSMTQTEPPDLYATAFKPAFLNYSGEIHFIMGKRFVLGAKGFIFSQQQHSLYTSTRNMKIFGNLLVGSLGFTVLDGKDNGFRLFPQIGVGAAQTGFQVKDNIKGNNDTLHSLLFNFVSDKLAEISKKSPVVDACLAMDWDWGFFPSMKCMSGIGCKPLLHAEFGYTFVTKETPWMRDSDKLTATEPKINFGGLYYGFGIGFAFTGGKD